MSGDQLTEGLEQPSEMAKPFGKLSSIDLNAAAGIDLGLPIEREMIAELGGRDMREEAGPGYWTTRLVSTGKSR